MENLRLTHSVVSSFPVSTELYLHWVQYTFYLLLLLLLILQTNMQNIVDQKGKSHAWNSSSSSMCCCLWLLLLCVYCIIFQVQFFWFMLNRCNLLWGTGIRGLMRGMTTLPHGKQELLVVRDEVGRPPGELGVSKSMECDIFPSVLWHCWLGDRKGIRHVKTGCWFVGGDDLTGALHDL